MNLLVAGLGNVHGRVYNTVETLRWVVPLFQTDGANGERKNGQLSWA